MGYDNELEKEIEEKIKSCSICGKPFVSGKYIQDSKCPVCSGLDEKVIRLAYNSQNKKLG